MVPQNLTEVLFFFVLVVPGVAFITVRDAVAGPLSAERSTPARLLEALFISIIFDAIYVVLFSLVVRTPPAQRQQSAGHHPALAGLGILALFLLAPGLFSYWRFGEWMLS